MTKEQLMEVARSIARVAYEFNQAQAEPDERGPGNDAIALVIYDDGSGKVGTMSFLPVFHDTLKEPDGTATVVGQEPFFNPQGQFDSPEQLVDIFNGWIEWDKLKEANL